MKQFLLSFCCLTFIIACGSSGPSPEMIAEGEKTYKKLCVACHGPDGKLALNGAKMFSESTLTWEERISVVTNGKNAMTPYKGVLSEAEIKAVAAYTIELGKQE